MQHPTFVQMATISLAEKCWDIRMAETMVNHVLLHIIFPIITIHTVNWHLSLIQSPGHYNVLRVLFVVNGTFTNRSIVGCWFYLIFLCAYVFYYMTSTIIIALWFSLLHYNVSYYNYTFDISRPFQLHDCMEILNEKFIAMSRQNTMTIHR